MTTLVFDSSSFVIARASSALSAKNLAAPPESSSPAPELREDVSAPLSRRAFPDFNIAPLVYCPTRPCARSREHFSHCLSYRILGYTPRDKYWDALPRNARGCLGIAIRLNRVVKHISLSVINTWNVVIYIIVAFFSSVDFYVGISPRNVSHVPRYEL
jgi:hypothetical protein